jgi:hypothetical protein
VKVTSEIKVRKKGRRRERRTEVVLMLRIAGACRSVRLVVRRAGKEGVVEVCGAWKRSGHGAAETREGRTVSNCDERRREKIMKGDVQPKSLK